MASSPSAARNWCCATATTTSADRTRARTGAWWRSERGLCPAASPPAQHPIRPPPRCRNAARIGLVHLRHPVACGLGAAAVEFVAAGQAFDAKAVVHVHVPDLVQQRVHGMPVCAWRILFIRSEEHTSELQSLAYLVCRLLLEKKKKQSINPYATRTTRK